MSAAALLAPASVRLLDCPYDLFDEHRDVATASRLEQWIDETERRTWSLFETSRRETTSGH